jgi:hypothetical protein
MKKVWKTSVRVVLVPTDLRSGYLHERSHSRYQFSKYARYIQFDTPEKIVSKPRPSATHHITYIKQQEQHLKSLEPGSVNVGLGYAVDTY